MEGEREVDSDVSEQTASGDGRAKYVTVYDQGTITTIMRRAYKRWRS